ncbi:MAG: RluA family pseudouridine synthase [Nodosilinea sp. LVE1205-7]
MVTNQGWIYRDRITPSNHGVPILDFYAHRYRHSSRADWQTRLESGQIWVDQRLATIQDRLRSGQVLAYHRPAWQEPAVPLDFQVIYEDGDLLAIAKPAGLPVLPGANFLTHTLLYQLQQRYGDPTPLPVHRLGRGTSGVMVMARSTQARADLSRQFRHGTLQPPGRSSPGKIYRALIPPGDYPDQFTMTTAIGKRADANLGYIYGATPSGKPAHSQVTVLERQSTATLVEVIITTGRPHQIRIHLAAAGYPLVGDPLYGPGGVPMSTVVPARRQETPGESSPGLGQTLAVPGDTGYYLHAHRLSLLHPHRQELLEFVAPLPSWGFNLSPCCPGGPSAIVGL